MNYDLLAALVVFAFVSSITPGPNNLMLMASGANFGFRRTVPHMLGVALGFVGMTIVLGLGLAQVFEIWPVTQDVLRWVSVAYLLWLARKIATAAPVQMGQGQGDPMTFLQAAGFQWVNPKAWSMSLTAISAYAPGQTAFAVLLVAVVFGMVNLPSVSTWVLVGKGMARLLTRRSYLVAFNWTMAGLLVLSLYPVLRAS